MWQLIITEIKYFKWIYIFSSALVVIINIGLTIDNRWIEAQNDFPGLRIIWLGVGIVVLFFPLLFNRKSGRLRNQVSLPISKIAISFSRIVPFIIFWIFLLFILVLFYFINLSSVPTYNWFIGLFSLTGMIFIINSIPLLYSDFYNTYFSKTNKNLLLIIWVVLWLSYILLNIIFSSYFDFIYPKLFLHGRDILTRTYFSSYFTILNIVTGIIFFFGSLFTFQKRKLYLD